MRGNISRLTAGNRDAAIEADPDAPHADTPERLLAMSPDQAWALLSTLLQSPGFQLLTATRRHAEVLGSTLEELPDLRGNICHYLYTAVLTRENGVSRISARDTDFHRFPFLTVVDPLR